MWLVRFETHFVKAGGELLRQLDVQQVLSGLCYVLFEEWVQQYLTGCLPHIMGHAS
jgi:hypothetical protein